MVSWLALKAIKTSYYGDTCVDQPVLLSSSVAYSVNKLISIVITCNRWWTRGSSVNGPNVLNIVSCTDRIRIEDVLWNGISWKTYLYEILRYVYFLAILIHTCMWCMILFFTTPTSRAEPEGHLWHSNHNLTGTSMRDTRCTSVF